MTSGAPSATCTKSKSTLLSESSSAGKWLLQRSSNILLIPGTSSVAHLRENLAAATFGHDLPPGDEVLREAIHLNGLNYLLTLDEVIAFLGGIPWIEKGKVIGGIGCSGGTNSQNEVVAVISGGGIGDSAGN
jgi:heme-degrading protein